MSDRPARLLPRGLLPLAALVLLGTILWRFPARWALAMAPAGVACESPSGSLWRGACQGLHLARHDLQAATWQVHALPLLRGRLAIDLQVDDPQVAGTVQLQAGGGQWLARQLHLRMPLDASWLPFVPRGWGGSLVADLDSLDLAAGHVTALRGSVRALGLHQSYPPTPLGTLALRFDGSRDPQGRLLGQVLDEGGPLALSGQLRLASDGNYRLDGQVAPRAEAAPALASSLQFLGPADAEGRRPFSLAGIY